MHFKWDNTNVNDYQHILGDFVQCQSMKSVDLFIAYEAEMNDSFEEVQVKEINFSCKYVK